MRRAIFVLLLLSTAGAEDWTYLSAYNYVHSIVELDQLLYLGTRGGIVVYDIILREIRDSYVFDDGADLLTPDLMSSDLFYVSGGTLYRRNPFMSFPSELADVGWATSLGTGSDYVYVEQNGVIRRYSKSGIYAGKGSAPPNVIWSGDLGEIDRDDIGITFLAPFFRETGNLGRVDDSVYYRNGWRLWVGTWGAGVFLYDANLEMIQDSIRPGIHPGGVEAIHASEEEIWVGGAGGFSRFDDGGWTEFSRGGDYAISCTEIVDISGDDNTAWFATECGIMKYDGGRIRSRRMPPGVSSWTTCCLADEGMLWIGTDDGIAYLDLATNDIDRVKQSEGLYINDIVATGQNVYVLTDRGAVVYGKELGDWSYLSDPRAWSSSNVETALSDGDELYLATSSGIVRFREGGEDTTYITTPFNSVGQPILSMALLDGTLYVGTMRGLYGYEIAHEHWFQVSRSQGLLDDYIAALATIPGVSTLYIGSPSGLTLYRP
jgi:hypothetical protein